MRKALIYLVIPFLLATVSNAGAQVSAADMDSISSQSWIHMDGEFMRQLQKRDSILIGDQMEYGFRLEDQEEGTAFGTPRLSNSVIEQFSDEWDLKILDRKSQGAGKPDLIDVEASITIAAFEEGDYKLPPIIIGRVSPTGKVDTLYFDPVDIKVTTVPIDTATFKRHGMKGIIDVPYNWEEFLYDLNKLWTYVKEELLVWIISGKWLVILLIVAYCIWRLRQKNMDVVGAYANEPAHIVALRKLDGLRSNAMWVPEKQKAFYSGVTDTLREYISRRYGVPALEMTTAELFDNMKVTDLSAEQLEELHNLFVRADFVKFAKYVASDEDNAATVPLAVRFVTQTYQSDLIAQQGQVGTDVEKTK